MLYLSTPSNPLVRKAMRAGHLGAMMNPKDGKSVSSLEGITFAVDNGCFADAWSPDRWLQALDRYRPLQSDCLFAVVPDVVGDAEATRARWDEWNGEVISRGYRPAYVAQDGLVLDSIPWVELAVWFTGGTDDFKFSAQAHNALMEAKARGKHTHCGRVNSLRKLRAARDLGYDTADGTYIAFGPDINLARVNGWMSDLRRTPHLGERTASDG